MYRSMACQSAEVARGAKRAILEHYDDAATSWSFPPRRSTLAVDEKRLVVVDEWESDSEYESHQRADDGGCFWNENKRLHELLLEPPTVEYYPEAWHISKPRRRDEETIGILVRQRAASAEDGAALRDAQREAYERQMPREPGCTCCIILGPDVDVGAGQVRIIELWKTMDDFAFHENSEWHARGEEKVVPLVIDMDCDFVRGYQLLQN